MSTRLPRAFQLRLNARDDGFLLFLARLKPFRRQAQAGAYHRRSGNSCAQARIELWLVQAA